MVKRLHPLGPYLPALLRGPTRIDIKKTDTRQNLLHCTDWKVKVSNQTAATSSAPEDGGSTDTLMDGWVHLERSCPGPLLLADTRLSA